MIGVCAGYFRPRFFSLETIILRESNSHARCQVNIPHMGTRLQTSCKVDLTPSRKEEKTQTENIRRSSGMNHVNLVEIDLLRGGQRMPMLDPWPDSPHTLLIARAGSQLCRVWRAHYRRSLSVIPVPLAKPDSDIPLDLQPMIDEIYQRFRYPRSIDYTKPLTPPLDAAETGWLKQQLHVRRDRR
jgi:hypothetical protein